MARGPKTRIVPTSLAAELLLGWMERKRVSQRMLASYLGWSLTRVYRVLSGKIEPVVSEAFEVEDVTDGAVPARTWVTKATGARFGAIRHEAKMAHKPSH